MKVFRRNSTDGASASTNQIAPSNLCFNTSCGTCCKTLSRVPARRLPKKCIELQHIFLSSYLVSSMLLPPGSSLQWSVPTVSSYQGKRKSSEFSFARLKVVSLHSDMQENTSSRSMFDYWTILACSMNFRFSHSQLSWPSSLKCLWWSNTKVRPTLGAVNTKMEKHRAPDGSNMDKNLTWYL